MFQRFLKHHLQDSLTRILPHNLLDLRGRGVLLLQDCAPGNSGNITKNINVIHIFVPAGAYRQTEDLRPAGQNQQVLPPPHHLPSRDIVKQRIIHSPHQLRPWHPPGVSRIVNYL